MLFKGMKPNPRKFQKAHDPIFKTMVEKESTKKTTYSQKKKQSIEIIPK